MREIVERTTLGQRSDVQKRRNVQIPRMEGEAIMEAACGETIISDPVSEQRCSAAGKRPPFAMSQPLSPNTSFAPS
jgi:hypothetical protein